MLEVYLMKEDLACFELIIKMFLDGGGGINLYAYSIDLIDKGVR